MYSPKSGDKVVINGEEHYVSDVTNTSFKAGPHTFEIRWVPIDSPNYIDYMEKEGIINVPEVDYITLLQADLDTTLQLCKVNTYFNSICEDEGFWKEKIKIHFGNLYVTGNYKQSYIDLVKGDIRQAAKDGKFFVLQYYRPKPEDYAADELTALAALSGNRMLFEWLTTLGHEVGYFALGSAILGGSEEIFDLIMETDIIPLDWNIQGAADLERLYVLNYMLEVDENLVITSLTSVYVDLVFDGRIKTLDWIFDYTNLRPTEDTINKVYLDQHYGMADYFAQRGYLPTQHASTFAAINNDLDVLKTLNILPNHLTMPYIILLQQNDVFKWLYERNVRYNNSILLSFYCNKELYSYLVEQGEVLNDGSDQRVSDLAFLEHQLESMTIGPSQDALFAVIYLHDIKNYDIYRDYMRQSNYVDIMAFCDFRYGAINNRSHVTEFGISLACRLGHVRMLEILDVIPSRSSYGFAVRNNMKEVMNLYPDIKPSPLDIKIAQDKRHEHSG